MAEVARAPQLMQNADTLCSSEEDKNSSRHPVGLSKKERQKQHRMRKTATKRYAQTGRLRYTRRPAVNRDWLVKCLAAF